MIHSEYGVSAAVNTVESGAPIGNIDRLSVSPSGHALTNLRTSADKLLSRPDLADRFVLRHAVVPSSAQLLSSQPTPLDNLYQSGPAADIDQTTDATGIGRGASSVKSPQQRLTELSMLAGSAIGQSNLRNVHTLETPVNRTGQPHTLMSTSEVSPTGAGSTGVQPVSPSTLNHKVVQLTLEKDNGLAGAKNQLRYNLATSGLQAAQPLEPSQPPVKSPVGGLSVAQTGLDVRSVQHKPQLLSELTIEPEIDAGRLNLGSMEHIQRDPIKSLDTSLPGNLAPETPTVE